MEEGAFNLKITNMKRNQDKLLLANNAANLPLRLQLNQFQTVCYSDFSCSQRKHRKWVGKRKQKCFDSVIAPFEILQKTDRRLQQGTELSLFLNRVSLPQEAKKIQVERKVTEGGTQEKGMRLA